MGKADTVVTSTDSQVISPPLLSREPLPSSYTLPSASHTCEAGHVVRACDLGRKRELEVLGDWRLA